MITTLPKSYLLKSLIPNNDNNSITPDISSYLSSLNSIFSLLLSSISILIVNKINPILSQKIVSMINYPHFSSFQLINLRMNLILKMISFLVILLMAHTFMLGCQSIITFIQIYSLYQIDKVSEILNTTMTKITQISSVHHFLNNLWKIILL